jgi:hypothetical protein
VGSWGPPPRAALVSRGPRLARAAGGASGLDLTGLVGDALFAFALSRFAPAVDPFPALERAVEACSAADVGVSLHEGVAGLGFVVALYTDEEELLVDVDEVALSLAHAVPPASLQSGAAGLGLYASLRSGAPSGRALQRAVIDVLSSRATPVADGGVVWETPPDYARGRQVDVLAEPVVELGMVHGNAGTLVALSALLRAGCAGAEPLLRAGLRGAWAHEGPKENRFGWVHFGARGAAGREDLGAARWCVGDIGVARGLWLAARALQDEGAARRALAILVELAETDAAREVSPADRLDLCCGCASVAQVHLEMHRDTGEPIFARANRRLARACGAGAARMAHSSFRYGSMGAVLASLSSMEPEHAGWDAILGISLPPVVPAGSLQVV